jgi:acetyl esterase
MPVKDEVQPILVAIEAARAPLDEQTPELLREGYAALSGMGTVEDVASVTDRAVPGPAGDLPVRIYRPEAVTGQAAPGLVYFHGGGWVIGNVDTHDNVCRALANAAGIVVVSVDYRLAPENRFPAALDDALASVEWVRANARELEVDPTRLAVGGDSAGGNLAALVSQHLAGEPTLRFQLLVYPLLDARYQEPSIEENAEGYFLTKEMLVWFRDQYIGAAGDPADPLVSPACAPDSALAGLPPGLVITAEYDPLRDEGEAYAERCRAAGVEMTATRYDGMIHGFFSMSDWVPDGRVAIDEAAAALRQHL